MERCGEEGWKSDYKKNNDIHLLGINIRQSDIKAMAEELAATNYTVETKSNLIIALITFEMIDYKVVKVIRNI